MDYMSIIACIPIGRANRITRERLSRITGKTDRINRRAIEEARKAGIPVISSSYDRGYYIAETQEEIDSLLRETWARIRSLLKTYWTLKKRLRIEGQMTLYELEELFKVKAEVEENE